MDIGRPSLRKPPAIPVQRRPPALTFPSPLGPADPATFAWQTFGRRASPTFDRD